MIIRPETPEDIPAISAVVEAAFGQPDEARLVERLRAARDVAISLVAEDRGRIVGHVLFSPMRAPFRALGLGPVAVAPARQGNGVGAALIREGLARAEAEGREGVFVLGEPAYYGRFGFSADLARGYESPYAGPYLQLLPFADPLPTSGRIDYAPAFAAFE